MNTEQSLERRARVHAALGDPARLAIVDALGVGDASPGELGRALDLPTNLLAHHVNVLQDAGIVDRVRSEGDRRRTYLRLRPDALLELRLPALPTAAERIVFVCTHNSARSPLAAALWTRHTRRPAASAGTDPARRVHPRAVRVARRHGLDLDPTGTAHAENVVLEGDLVIAVCDNAHEHLATGPTRLRPRLHWSVPDPARVDSDAAFEAAYADLEARITRLSSALDPSHSEGVQP